MGVPGWQAPTPKISAPIEMPDHGDLPQHDTTLRHGEVQRSLQQICAAQRAREVVLTNANRSFQELRHYRLTIPGLWNAREKGPGCSSHAGSQPKKMPAESRQSTSVGSALACWSVISVVHSPRLRASCPWNIRALLSRHGSWPRKIKTHTDGEDSAERLELSDNGNRKLCSCC